jgi:hypothetical protein
MDIFKNELKNMKKITCLSFFLLLSLPFIYSKNSSINAENGIKHDSMGNQVVLVKPTQRAIYGFKSTVKSATVKEFFIVGTPNIVIDTMYGADNQSNYAFAINGGSIFSDKFEIDKNDTNRELAFAFRTEVVASYEDGLPHEMTITFADGKMVKSTSTWQDLTQYSTVLDKDGLTTFDIVIHRQANGLPVKIENKSTAIHFEYDADSYPMSETTTFTKNDWKIVEKDSQGNWTRALKYYHTIDESNKVTLQKSSWVVREIVYY